MGLRPTLAPVGVSQKRAGHGEGHRESRSAFAAQGAPGRGRGISVGWPVGRAIRAVGSCLP